MRSEMPGSLQRSATRDERRLRELDRKQANTSLDLSAMPRGIVAWHRRTTSRIGMSVSGTGYSIASIGCNIVRGRVYEIYGAFLAYTDEAYGTHRHADNKIYYTTNGLEPTTSSSLLTHSVSPNRGGGIPLPVVYNELLHTNALTAAFDAAGLNTLPLRVLYTFFPGAAVEFKAYGTVAAPMRFWIKDMGLDTEMSDSGGIDY